jgi:formate dehydrogenase major subunit/formate dehydrogenase alpha subunit
MTNSLDDIAEAAESYLVIGSNTTAQHPVLGVRLRRAAQQRGAVIIVADPRSIPLTELATLHIRHRPGTDVALLNGIAHVLVRSGWVDQEFITGRTEGFAEYKTTLEKYPPDVAAEICGLSVEDIETAARLLWEHRPGAVLYAMGITQHISGVNNVLAIANLQMLLGNLGKPGSGVNPLRGQNNVQGACDMGGLPNVYPGYQSAAVEVHRDKFAAAWGYAPGLKPGLTLTEIFDAAGQGTIRAIYMVGENPAMTDPDVGHLVETLSKCEFLVCQDLFLNETSQLAHVILPAASFAERDGTFTNTERRVQRVRAAVAPPGEARPDWRILADLAPRLLRASGESRDGPYAGWDYASPSEVMTEIAALTPSYAGISYPRLEPNGLQWPCPSPDHPGTPILHTERFTRGQGRFVPVDYVPPSELADEEYPMILTTGRVLEHWHGRTMTSRTPLEQLNRSNRVTIHPEDAIRMGIDDGDRVRVISRRGEVHVHAEVSESVQPGLVFMTFHFAETNANILTHRTLEPTAKTPAFKVSAVRVERLDTARES